LSEVFFNILFANFNGHSTKNKLFMNRKILLLILAAMTTHVYSQKYIADHEVAKEEVLRNIPVKYIHKARMELKVSYQHTSHGSQVYQGFSGLLFYKPGDYALFGLYPNPKVNRLLFRDNFMYKIPTAVVNAVDLSRDEIAFIQTTRDYLDAPENADINVIMWSWCDIAGRNVSSNYLLGMDSLISGSKLPLSFFSPNWMVAFSTVGTGLSDQQKPC